MTPIQTAVAVVQDKQGELAVLMDQLRMWSDVEAQGIDSSEGGTFTWKDEWASKRKPRLVWSEEAGRPVREKLEVFDASTHYNAIRLPGKDWQQLNPPVRKPIK